MVRIQKLWVLFKFRWRGAQVPLSHFLQAPGKRALEVHAKNYTIGVTFLSQRDHIELRIHVEIRKRILTSANFKFIRKVFMVNIFRNSFQKCVFS